MYGPTTHYTWIWRKELPRNNATLPCVSIPAFSMCLIRVFVFSFCTVLFRRQLFQGFLRPLIVVLHQPAHCDFPCFIQCSQQVKKPGFLSGVYFWTVRYKNFVSAHCSNASVSSSSPLSSKASYHPFRHRAIRWAGILMSIPVVSASWLKLFITSKVRKCLTQSD